MLSVVAVLRRSFVAPFLSKIVATRWTGGGLVVRITLGFSLVSSFACERCLRLSSGRLLFVASTPLHSFLQGGEESKCYSKRVF